MTKKQKEQQRKKARDRKRLKIKQEIMTQIAEIACPNMPSHIINSIGNPDGMAAFDQHTAEVMRYGMEGKWIDGTPMTVERYSMLTEIFEKLYLEGQSEEVRNQILKRVDDFNRIQRETKLEFSQDECERIINKWHDKYTSGVIAQAEAAKYLSYECGCWFKVAAVLDNNNIPLDILSIDQKDLIYKCTANGRWTDGRKMHEHFDSIILELVDNA